MLPRLMDVLRRDVTFYPGPSLQTFWIGENPGPDPLMYTVSWPGEEMRVWHEPIEDEL